MRKTMLALGLLAATLGLLGCGRGLHVELEDGTIVSLVPPRAAFDTGAFEKTLPCKAYPDIGLQGHVRTTQTADTAATTVVTLTNASGKPLTIKRVFAYAFYGEGKEVASWTCDAATGIHGTIRGKGQEGQGKSVKVTYRSPDPGATYRLARADSIDHPTFRKEGDTLIAVFGNADEKPGTIRVVLPEGTPIRPETAVCRPLFGGRVLATGHPGRTEDGKACLVFNDIPPCLAAEIAIGLEPGKPVPEGRFAPPGEDDERIVILGFANDTRRTLAPGATCAYTLQFVSTHPEE